MDMAANDIAGAEPTRAKDSFGSLSRRCELQQNSEGSKDESPTSDDKNPNDAEKSQKTSVS